MVKSCSAYGCTNRFKMGGMRFFRLPINPKRRRLWIIAIRRKDWKPSLYSYICEEHFQTRKPSQDPNHPDYIPNIFVFTPAKKETTGRFTKKILERTVTNLAQMKVSDGAICQNKEEISRVENVVVKQIETESSSYTSALEQMREISGVQDVVVKQEIQNDDGANISALEQMKESQLKDELQQTKLELQQAYTNISTLVAEKDVLKQSLDAAEVAQNALFASVFDKDTELSKVKKELQETYSEINALRRKDTELTKVKKELQQAYSEINALRREKEEMAKRIPDADFTQSILQNQEKLYFYTGLNSVKDFQAVLSLIPLDESRSSYCIETKVLIVLIKLKLNLLNADLGYRFDMSRYTVKRTWDALILPLETKLELIVKSPINKALRRNIPHSFKNSVYENLYQRLRRFFKSKNKEDESHEPDLEQM